MCMTLLNSLEGIIQKLLVVRARLAVQAPGVLDMEVIIPRGTYLVLYGIAIPI